jgi:hypothetical protein
MELVNKFNSFSIHTKTDNYWLTCHTGFNNWYTRETQPIDPFVLEGLPLFTYASPRR